VEIIFKKIPLTLDIYETDTEFEVEDVKLAGISCLDIVGVNELAEIEALAKRTSRHRNQLAIAENKMDLQDIWIIK
jgi:hypothetical protein